LRGGQPFEANKGTGDRHTKKALPGKRGMGKKEKMNTFPSKKGGHAETEMQKPSPMTDKQATSKGGENRKQKKKGRRRVRPNWEEGTRVGITALGAEKTHEIRKKKKKRKARQWGSITRLVSDLNKKRPRRVSESGRSRRPGTRSQRAGEDSPCSGGKGGKKIWRRKKKKCSQWDGLRLDKQPAAHAGKSGAYSTCKG